MTSRDLKRLIRERMARTGEAYSVARRRLEERRVAMARAAAEQAVAENQLGLPPGGCPAGICTPESVVDTCDCRWPGKR